MSSSVLRGSRWEFKLSPVKFGICLCKYLPSAPTGLWLNSPQSSQSCPLTAAFGIHFFHNLCCHFCASDNTRARPHHLIFQSVPAFIVTA